jgi:predicted metal-dependent phosphoesterase TrpH
LPYRKGGPRDDYPYVNFYWDYFGQGKPCYTNLDFPDLIEAIKMVKDNGGRAVLAHPGLSLKNHRSLFSEIALSGINGVEAFCSYHSEDDAKYFYEQAERLGLFVTCGSDYHGKNKPAVFLRKTGCFLSDAEMENQLEKGELI